MNIGEASEKTGLPAKTIRYYEDIGLVVADRQSNGYRDYSNEHIERLSFLKRAREFGFPVEDCRKLLGLYSDEQRHTSEIGALAAHHLEELQLKAPGNPRPRRSTQGARRCLFQAKTTTIVRSSQNFRSEAGGHERLTRGTVGA